MRDTEKAHKVKYMQAKNTDNFTIIGRKGNRKTRQNRKKDTKKKRRTAWYLVQVVIATVTDNLDENNFECAQVKSDTK